MTLQVQAKDKLTSPKVTPKASPTPSALVRDPKVLQVLRDIHNHITTDQDPKSPAEATAPLPQTPDLGTEVDSVGSVKRRPRSRSRSVSVSSRNRDQPDSSSYYPSIRDRSGSLRTTRVEPRLSWPTQRTATGSWPVNGIPEMGQVYPSGTIEELPFM